MSDKLFFLQPVFQHRIWGGRDLEEKFGYDLPEGSVGECWGISAHPNGASIIKNGIYAGKILSELWSHTPELFGEQHTEVFPLLVKILDANDDLSVQVHPNDAYAHQHEFGEFGKTECWYILDCDDDANIVFGHNANTKEEMLRMVENGKWDQLLRRQPVKKGDFFYVPSGTIHAIGKGILILEVQQSSDTTYRLYDYGRRDSSGNLRQLHINKAIDASTIPHISVNPEPKMVTNSNELKIIQLVSNEFFTVFKYEVNGASIHEFSKPATYSLVNIIHGSGLIDEMPVKKGDHIIVKQDAGALTFVGVFDAIVTQP